MSYSRFVAFIPSTLGPLCAYLRQCYGSCTGTSCVEATALAVCHNRRIAQPKVFADLAAQGRTSVGWFFGFTLHLVVNDRGEVLRGALTPGNTDDRKPVPKLAHSLFGKLFADKGYLSAAVTQEWLTTLGVHVLTPLKRKMKPCRLLWTDKLLRRKRAMVETIFDQLKNSSQIEHSRPRRPSNFLVNLLCGLIAYCHQPKKPALHLPACPTFPLA